MRARARVRAREGTRKGEREESETRRRARETRGSESVRGSARESVGRVLPEGDRGDQGVGYCGEGDWEGKTECKRERARGERLLSVGLLSSYRCSLVTVVFLSLSCPRRLSHCCHFRRFRRHHTLSTWHSIVVFPVVAVPLSLACENCWWYCCCCCRCWVESANVRNLRLSLQCCFAAANLGEHGL